MAHNCTLKKILAALLCLCLLLGSVGVLAEDVANVTDKKGPSLFDLNFVQNKKTLYTGDTLNLSLKARDRSGVNSVHVSFVTKNWNWIELELDYNPETDLFEGAQKLTSSDVSGSYYLYSISAFDTWGNQSNYYTAKEGSSSLGKFTLKSDIKAKVKLKENKKTVKPTDKLHFTVELTNAPENTKYVDVVLENKTDWYGRGFSNAYDSETGKSIIEGTFAWTDEKGKTVCPCPNGKYELTRVYLYDENYDEIVNIEASGQYVTLTGSDGKPDDDNDKNKPKISSAKLKEKGKTLSAGKTIHVEAKVKANKSGMTSVSAYFYPMDSTWRVDKKTQISKSTRPATMAIELKKKSGNKWTGEYKLPESTPNCAYYLVIEVNDKDGYYLNGESFADQYFTFEDKDFVTEGIKYFIQETVNAIGVPATETSINKWGMQLANGNATGVEIVKKVLDCTILSQEEKAKKLSLLMKGAEPSAEELAVLVTLDDETMIDRLAANTEFRELCENSNIVAGSFAKKADGLEIGVSKEIKKITLKPKKLSLKVKKSEWLTATVKPKDATAAGDLEWTSSDESVAKVSEWGEVTGVGAGECVITCKATDGSGVTAECKVTVKGKSKNSKNELKLAEPVEKVKLKVGESQRITLTNADMKVKWSSSDKSVAKVTSSGKIKAVGKGKCTITCEAEDGSKIEIPVKVK